MSTDSDMSPYGVVLADSDTSLVFTDSDAWVGGEGRGRGGRGGWRGGPAGAARYRHVSVGETRIYLCIVSIYIDR
jgi:hypothetical protein